MKIDNAMNIFGSLLLLNSFEWLTLTVQMLSWVKINWVIKTQLIKLSSYEMPCGFYWSFVGGMANMQFPVMSVTCVILNGKIFLMSFFSNLKCPGFLTIHCIKWINAHIFILNIRNNNCIYTWLQIQNGEKNRYNSCLMEFKVCIC